VDKVNKSKLLASLVKGPDVRSALVFTRTKHGADKVARDLNRAGIPALAIHGNKSQNARQTALHRFMAGEIGVLVATDIAARGLDIAELSHVFNYDIPEDPETYIHRIGRTGRAGLSGDAVSFCCYDELERLFAVEKLTGKQIPVTDCPFPMEVCTYSAEPTRRPQPARGQAQPHRRPSRRR
jgi:ATP-dependent RNA helicase RhlE